MEKIIKIVALGDSLTEGLVSSSWSMCPYTDYLQELAGPGIKIINKGISGELTAQMHARFNRDVRSLKPDYMILLGGANDIGWGIEQGRIIECLKTICRQAKESEIAPVLCAIPPVEGHSSANDIRFSINSELKNFCIVEGFCYVDLYTPLLLAGELSPQFSDDGLHLSPEGYREMACVIFDTFLKLV